MVKWLNLVWIPVVWLNLVWLGVVMYGVVRCSVFRFDVFSRCDVVWCNGDGSCCEATTSSHVTHLLTDKIQLYMNRLLLLASSIFLLARPGVSLLF